MRATPARRAGSPIMTTRILPLVLLVAACSATTPSSTEPEVGDIATQGDFCRSAATVTCDLATSCGGSADREACIDTRTASCQQELQGCTSYESALAQDCLDAMMAGTCAGKDAPWLGAATSCDFGCP